MQICNSSTAANCSRQVQAQTSGINVDLVGGHFDFLQGIADEQLLSFHAAGKPTLFWDVIFAGFDCDIEKFRGRQLDDEAFQQQGCIRGHGVEFVECLAATPRGYKGAVVAIDMIIKRGHFAGIVIGSPAAPQPGHAVFPKGAG